MGERSNIAIERGKGEETERVYLYAHWDGGRNVEYAVHGLESGRATDAPYLARVIFNYMTKHDPEGETGYGISASLDDNEYPVVVINPDERLVWMEQGWGTLERVTPKVGYAQFIAAVGATKGDEYGHPARVVEALNVEGSES